MFISFDGIINARDIGGIALASGKKVKSRRLIRSAGLYKASDSDLLRLKEEFDLAFVADFRDKVETDREPDRAVEGAKYLSLPALPPFPKGGYRGNRPANPDFDARFREIYSDLALSDCAAEAYRGFFDSLLEAKGRGVLWHCTQGKDRTGIAALLLLTALGADAEAIKADYFLSNEGLAFMIDAPAPEGMRPWPREIMTQLVTVYPHILQVYLDAIEKEFGGAEGYLRRRLGLTDADFAALREYYTE